MTMEINDARNRLMAAAFRLGAAERGGLDVRDAEGETLRAKVELDDAVRTYHQALSSPAEGDVPDDLPDDDDPFPEGPLGDPAHDGHPVG